MLKNRIISQYIFFQMVPSFILGIIAFTSIILMFQALRLTEFVLVHGAGLDVLLHIIGYLSISFLPGLLPMSVLFAVLITYGRLSSDSEVVAMKSLGLSMRSITMPGLILGCIVALLSAQTSSYTGPWGNRQFEVLISQLGSMKAAIQLREGTFSEGFFDLVVYANKVDSESGRLQEVFIYDERNPETNLTIVAQAGQVIQDPNRPGHEALLRLEDGQVHRKGESYTVINFKSYDLKLMDPVKIKTREKSLLSLSNTEILERLEAGPGKKETLELKTEYHKRFAISVTGIVFALLGVGLGTTTNRRSAKSGGMVVSLVVVVIYWALYIGMESTARSGGLPPWFAIWLPNAIFFIASIYYLRRASIS